MPGMPKECNIPYTYKIITSKARKVLLPSKVHLALSIVQLSCHAYEVKTVSQLVLGTVSHWLSPWAVPEEHAQSQQLKLCNRFCGVEFGIVLHECACTVENYKFNQHPNFVSGLVFSKGMDYKVKFANNGQNDQKYFSYLVFLLQVDIEVEQHVILWYTFSGKCNGIVVKRNYIP